MESILQEQGFQQSGCTSTECVVEMGKLLNVQMIISGSIGKVGKIYTIDISLIDVKTARIEKSFIFDHDGEIGGLVQKMETIAHEIAATVTGEKLAVKEFGSLEIKTDPKKAQVYLDGTLLGTSPITTNEISAGTHLVQIKSDGYDAHEKNIVINPNQVTKLDIRLKKVYKLSVTSDPAGAQVLINSIAAGSTPYNAAIKEGMRFEIKLQKENYQEWSKQIVVKKDVKIEERLKITDAYKQQLAKSAKDQAAADKEKEAAAMTKTGEQKKGGGISSWWWIGGGAAIVAGGAAYYFLSQKDDEEVDTGMPLPVGRPQ
jgi:hypothetical protein